MDYRDGKGKRRREPVEGSKDIAHRVLAKRLEEAELELERKLGVRMPEKRVFRDFAKEFMRLWAEPNKRSAWRDEITIRSHLLPMFEEMSLTEISARDVEVYKARRARKVKPATVNRELECLKTMLAKAVEWGHLTANPAAKVRKFRVDNRRLVFLETEEIDSLLKSSSSDVRPVFAALVWTGMRKSECFRLRWSDVDLERRVITLLETKNGKSRDIPITEDLYEVLRRVPRHIKSEYVFCRPDGQPWKDLRGSLKAAVARAGIGKPVTLHTLRHTFASHLVMSGVELLTVMELMGHSTLDMVQRYAHLSPRHKRQAMDRFQRHLRGTHLAPAQATGKRVSAND